MRSLLQTIPETTPGQSLLALIILLGLASIVLLARYWSSTRGLGERQREHRRAVRRDRADQTPARSVLRARRIRAGDVDLDAEFRALLTAGREYGETSLARAGRTILGSVWAAWQPRLDRVPRPLRVGLRWALLVAVVGAIATSTAGVTAVLRSEPEGLSVAAVVSALGGALHTVVDVVSLFPFAGTITQVSVSIGVLAGQVLYEWWWLLASTVLGLAVVVTALEYRVPGLNPQGERSRSVLRAPGYAVVGVVAWLTVVWVAGTLPTVVVGVVFPSVAPWIGLAVAGVVGAVLGYWVVRWWVPRVRIRLRTRDEWSRGVAAWWLAYRSLQAVLGVAAVLTAVYAGVAIVDGRVGAVVNAIATAPLTTKAVLGLLGALGLVALVAGARDAAPTVRQVLAEVAAQKALRARLVTAGIPGILVVVAYTFAYQFVGRAIGEWQGVVASLVAAMLIGVLAYVLLTAVRYARLISDPMALFDARRYPVFVTTLGYVVTDADGREHYHLQVNGERVAGESVDAVVPAAVETARALANAQPPPASRAGWYARALFRFGLVDPEAIDTQLNERIRKRMFGVLRQHDGRVERERFDRALEDYPDERVERLLARFAAYIHATDRAVVLRRDPFRSETHSGAPTDPLQSD